MRYFIFALLFSTLSLAAEMSRDDMRAMATRSKSGHDFAKAQTIYETWLDSNPNDYEVQLWLAQVLSWQHFYDEAEVIYRNLLAVNPRYFDADFAFAQVLSWQGRLRQSLARLDRLSKQAPDNIEVKQERERVLRELAARETILARLGGDFQAYNYYAVASFGLKASFSYAQRGDWAVRAFAYGLSRFAQKSGQFGLGGSLWLTSNWVLEIDGDISSNTELLPRFSAAFATNVTFDKVAALALSLRMSQYTNATSLVAVPAFVWNIVEPLEFTAKFYGGWTTFSDGRGAATLVGLAKLNYTPINCLSINLGTSAGMEPFDPGNPAIPLGSYISGHLFGGIKVFIVWPFGVELSFDQEWRNNGQNVFGGEAAVFYNW
jgi:hypothetical protein